MPAIGVGDANLYYEVHGEGAPLLLIRGLRRNLEGWYCRISPLSRHFKAVSFDNRGAGRSDKRDREYAIPRFASDTAESMEASGLDSAHVLGISMGGYIVQALALNHLTAGSAGG